LHLDTALNLFWLLLGIAALAGTLRVHRQKQVVHGTRGPVWLHVCGVALIVAALFPFISATDDVLRIERLRVQHEAQHQQDSGKKTPSENLIRLYETLDAPMICAVSQISVILSFVYFVFFAVAKQEDRSVPQITGRSPPAVYFS
jgi:Ca2+/H+ antiporter